MKTIAIVAVASVAILVSVFDFYAEGYCPRYQSSNYETGIGETGRKCEVTLEVRRVKERHEARFEDEWTIE
jgi:hypothetical protein